MQKRLLFIFLSGILLLPFTLPETASAQWSLGASYEMRDEDPTNGFGLRVERSLFNSLPVVDFGLRAHFSYFNESNSVSNGITIEQDFESYDYGLAATGGVSVGLVSPYVGFGIGQDNSTLETSGDIDEINGAELDVEQPFDESDFYWNAFVGAKVKFIPVLEPFIEYRFTKISGRDDIGIDDVSRLALGISLRF